MNSAIKVLHCADVHIGAAESFLGTKAAYRRSETLLTVEHIMDIVKKNGIQLMLIAGDFFDSNKISTETAEKIFAQIGDLKETAVVAVAGNHDPLNSESPYKRCRLPENLYVFGPEDEYITIESLNTRVYGKSFDNVYLKGEDSFKLKPTEDGYINIAVLHGDFGYTADSRYNPITPQFIENSGMDYIAFGHIHKRSEISKLGGTYYAYPGCPEGHGFDETGAKGVYVGEIGKNYCNMEFMPTARRMYIYEKADLTLLSEGESIYEKIISVLAEKYGASYGENLYKIELCGTLPTGVTLDKAELASRLSEQVYYVKIKDKTELQYDFDTLSKEISLKGLFVKNMLLKLENAGGDERENIRAALSIGLKAFNAEVTYNED